ncbi:hypothetical protein [Teichococcus vastitatis]|jgi:hypothetical protein|uniref:Uncharacterized protein n=1 Tax=Teichococcus vastitatis TaxID=2307076 RepID=A0ABS9WCZ5_9PROT|nr:hypothetical protein [Pseudoroseomonas vastitatis]MCI0757167.1 hypothetical protein [Pseudoroseomonas vastitatis]
MDVDLIIFALVIPVAAIFLLENLIAKAVVEAALREAAAEQRAIRVRGDEQAVHHRPHSSEIPVELGASVALS